MLEIGIEKRVLHCVCFHNRPVIGERGGGGMHIAHAWMLGRLGCFLKTSISQLGIVEDLKVRQNWQRMKNNYFQFIHKI